MALVAIMLWTTHLRAGAEHGDPGRRAGGLAECGTCAPSSSVEDAAPDWAQRSDTLVGVARENTRRGCAIRLRDELGSPGPEGTVEIYQHKLRGLRSRLVTLLIR